MKVTFIIANTFETVMALTNENSFKPYKKRAVIIELTPEQVALIGIKQVGAMNGQPWSEEILECFVNEKLTP